MTATLLAPAPPARGQRDGHATTRSAALDRRPGTDAASADPPPADAAPRVTPEMIATLRPDLLRHARMQLRDAGAAEDAVQDAIEAALRGRAGFAGRSSLRTWMFAILRHRIIDQLREADRCMTIGSVIDDNDDWNDALDALFDGRGAWRDGAAPSVLPVAPDGALESRQLDAAFAAALDELPQRTARVFVMRELLGLEVEEICAELGITPGNCHVILHRARLRLRECLDAGWGPRA
ncbi:sigma-70 family RNA polymerase sigma factor [Derxia gummosa]|uniref:Sigma-70 family RNA polymerase sigma factor n=1 Tax=Derxia gummosa DSM 723 TaxID=1121388 RepID=A0A8B6XA20_9BURK|nr:sigma-70 family RNA polymerase sigma factor [Derxia gummosa]